MRNQWIRSGHGFLLVYDITSRPSFDALPALHDQILREKGELQVPTVLVGNKCDLDGPARAVAVSEGAELATTCSCPFLEASAKARINVEESFFELVRLIRADAPAGARPTKPASKMRQAVSSPESPCRIPSKNKKAEVAMLSSHICS